MSCTVSYSVLLLLIRLLVLLLLLLLLLLLCCCCCCWLQVQSEAVAAADVLGAAKGLLVSQPEGLLQRLIGQVMDLLGVTQLEGLPATVNRVSGLRVWGSRVVGSRGGALIPSRGCERRVGLV